MTNDIKKAIEEEIGRYLYETDGWTTKRCSMEYISNFILSKWEESTRWRKEEEHKEQIPELAKHWIEEGHKHIASEYWNKWDECVPIRLRDLYQGMELDCTIKIIQILNKSNNLNATYLDAKAEIESQGHSGMSFGLVCSMVKSFHVLGQSFVSRLRSEL